MSRATHIMYKLVQNMKSYGFGFTPTFPRSALRRFWTPAVTPSIKRESNMNMMPIGVDVDVPPFCVTSKWTRIERGVREYMYCGNREFFKVQGPLYTLLHRKYQGESCPSQQNQCVPRDKFSRTFFPIDRIAVPPIMAATWRYSLVE